ncbi:MAG: hypothetical protein A3J48_00090 [Candidatus Doudnabacteria bacterium RIFCSPHIGHO2_02_FULL_46_11]|uniref:CAAX prenyl protease 2/Lysostaphin resistance protein A-like domain-containing protein n=1 Tax=Candidatus Doudnabacteria bacterium RIFCSPHIGHO2_02_FULL_46_11 TaxID=1817832 RepID=A0A1F5PA29_9BACT|nr:MAG: hypothetical protein A3J48_00090 [Candidatus Doudnabacteria bacterium RIFCSPHIGHO2_02_FULL_46_11]
MYSILLISLPEEIIFRGVIQQLIQIKTDSAVIALLFSSAIYGGVHLLNGARGIKPKDWNWTLAALVCLAGISLGLIFVLTNSLLIPILLHTLLVICLKIYFPGL